MNEGYVIHRENKDGSIFFRCVEVGAWSRDLAKAYVYELKYQAERRTSPGYSEASPYSFWKEKLSPETSLPTQLSLF
jgi:hypothetical protein